jgi:hypothetical protein
MPFSNPRERRLIALVLVASGLLVAFVWGKEKVRYEYGVAHTWAAVASDMDILCWAVSRASPIDVKPTSDLSYTHLFGETLGDKYDPRTDTSIKSLFLGEGNEVSIRYWLPRDSERKVVFVTDAPLRQGFSYKYVHWIVTIDGKAQMISPAEFASLVARSAPSIEK